MARTTTVPIALAAVTLAAALAAWGTFGHEPGARHTAGEEHNPGEFLLVLGIIAVGAGAVFGWAVRRWLGSRAAGVAGLVLAVIGLLSVAIFWSGLPPVFAAGGALLGWSARETLVGKAAVLVAALAMFGDVLVYVADMT